MIEALESDTFPPPINWIGVAFGVMLLLLTALAATLPPPALDKSAPAKPAPTVTTQAALVDQASAN